VADYLGVFKTYAGRLIGKVECGCTQTILPFGTESGGFVNNATFALDGICDGYNLTSPSPPNADLIKIQNGSKKDDWSWGCKNLPTLGSHPLECGVVNAIAERIHTDLDDLCKTANRFNTKVIKAWLLDSFLTDAMLQRPSFQKFMKAKLDKLAVDTGIRNDITEQFITGMKSLFETSYIDIPEDKVDVVSELTTKVEELQSELNEEKRFIIEMTEVINQLKQNSIIEDVTDNLVKVDSAKIKELAENVEFINENDFRTKVETLKESYFPGTKKILTEDIVEEDPVKQVNGTMGVYTSTLDRMLS